MLLIEVDVGDAVMPRLVMVADHHLFQVGGSETQGLMLAGQIGLGET